MSYKIAIVGAGSTTFVPPFIELLIDSSPLRGSTLVLMDIDSQRLELMYAAARRLISHSGVDVTIERTVDRRKALTGADFVIVTAVVGGFDMYECDLEIPARYGIFTEGGETVGPGGMMNALRHIPLIVDICHELEQVSPDAWLFSYTNPENIVMRAMARESAIKKVCLCTSGSVPRWPEQLALMTGLEAADLVVPALVGGLNHCAVILELRLQDGRDAFPIILQRSQNPFAKEMLERYNVLPWVLTHGTEFYPGHTRLAEAYQGRVQGLKMMYGWHVRDMTQHRERVRTWEQAAKHWVETGEEKDKVFRSRLTINERIEVVDIIEALIENRNEIHSVITINKGAIPNLPFSAAVEVSSVVGGYGIHPVQVGSLPEPIAAILRRHIDTFELVVEAALTGSRKIALDALLIDPRTSAVLTPSETERLMNELLEAEAAFLPQFVG
jgi:alpha-galactosidase